MPNSTTSRRARALRGRRGVASSSAARSASAVGQQRDPRRACGSRVAASLGLDLLLDRLRDASECIESTPEIVLAADCGAAVRGRSRRTVAAGVHESGAADIEHVGEPPVVPRAGAAGLRSTRRGGRSANRSPAAGLERQPVFVEHAPGEREVGRLTRRTPPRSPRAGARVRVQPRLMDRAISRSLRLVVGSGRGLDRRGPGRPSRAPPCARRGTLRACSCAVHFERAPASESSEIQTSATVARGRRARPPRREGTGRRR